jgi:hypothetical protein
MTDHPPASPQRRGEADMNATLTDPTLYGTHIKFVPAPPKPKTKVWWVVNKYDEGQLGWVAWFSRWRKYSYFAKPETVYEQVCLREIAAFCEQQTALHKAARSAEGKP